MANKLKCPRCKGKIRLELSLGAKELGERTDKYYKRFVCDKCNLFWERGDVLE